MANIQPHHNCLQGEHVFIPSYMRGNGRDTFVEEFVCQHCLLKVNKREWEVHQQYLKRLAESFQPDVSQVQDLAAQSFEELVSNDNTMPITKPTPVIKRKPQKKPIPKPSPTSLA